MHLLNYVRRLYIGQRRPRLEATFSRHTLQYLNAPAL